VVDSMRRDYLSPYNPAVTFTPNIDRWARESHVFRNAFTQYGGTEMAMPSLWVGGPVPRAWPPVFRELDRLEPAIVKAGYDFVINDYTIEPFLLKDTRRTFIDRYLTNVRTDMCVNLTTLTDHLRSRRVNAPVFAFLNPMDVHIINTLVATGDERVYPGFYAPVASRLERIDTCFGDFMNVLKAEGLFDNSVIVLTADHGDSLGEEGRWGHRSYLVPEVVRIPLIIHLPSALQTTMATDLGRMSLLTDVAPTLLSLLDPSHADEPPPYGARLYVQPGEELRDRRRSSTMMMSSYGPTYGLLRRNGSRLYVADLTNGLETTYALGAVGAKPRPLGDADRRLNEAELVRHLRDLEQLYHRQ